MNNKPSGGSWHFKSCGRQTDGERTVSSKRREEDVVWTDQSADAEQALQITETVIDRFRLSSDDLDEFRPPIDPSVCRSWWNRVEFVSVARQRTFDWKPNSCEELVVCFTVRPRGNWSFCLHLRAIYFRKHTMTHDTSRVNLYLLYVKKQSGCGLVMSDHVSASVQRRHRHFTTLIYSRDW